MSNFFQELQRRNVLKAAISYVALSWALLEAADIIFPLVGISDQYILYLLIALSIGFPLWVIFAYVYEWTPAGFKKTREVEIEDSIHRETSKNLNFFIIGGMAFAIVLLVTDRVFNLTGQLNISDDNFKSIAVLPFENMSSAEDAYFTAGITEDILTQISKIGDLKVLSRMTLKEYDATGKTPEEIGAELNVRHLLVGSVRRSGNKLRIGCQLIDTATGTEDWAHTFDRQMEDVFQIQSEVAQELASLLEVQLSPEEEFRIELKPTDNLEAYNIYLQARSFYINSNAEDNELAITLFRRALELDPKFSLAWTGLANCYTKSISNYGIRPFAYFDTARVMAQKALTLDPESSDALESLGYLSFIKGDMNKAIDLVKLAVEKKPNNEQAVNVLGLLYREVGELDKAIGLFTKASKLNPLRIYVHLYNKGISYQYIGEYEKALDFFLQCVEMDKAVGISIRQIIEINVLLGNYDEAYRWIDQMMAEGETAYNYNHSAFLAHFIPGDTIAEKYFMKAFAAKDFDYLSFPETALGWAKILIQKNQNDSAYVVLDQFEKATIEEYGSEASDAWSSWIRAQIEILKGNETQALLWLEKGSENGVIQHDLLQIEPWMSSLHNSPEFVSLMDQEQAKMDKQRDLVSKSGWD